MWIFILTAVAISLSGVMAPGPITASAVVAGSRFRHAGALIALGHAVVEVPLILLLVAGLGPFLQSAPVQAGIGLAGGGFLLVMAVQLLLSLRAPEHSDAPVERHALVIGIVLTGANPYFLVWWATVGLRLTSEAMGFGIAILGLFVLVHWLCDLAWLEILSVAGYKGSVVFGTRSRRVVSALCAAVLLGFALKFIYDAGVAIAAYSATGN